MNKNGKRIVILGAGIAGLATAWKILRSNPEYQVTLIERDLIPGGLAKSVSWKGCPLDLGPHRFHTEIPEIKEFVRTFCEERMSLVKRASRMYLNGSYIPYPISMLPTFRALGLSMTISFALSALSVFFNRSSNPQSYEDYVKGYYGDSLYRALFKPFAEKVWGIPAEQITAETARVRLRGESIWHALKDNLFSSGETYVSQFLYPPGGIGDIPQQFAQEVMKMGGDILVRHNAAQIQIENDEVVGIYADGPQGTVELPCDLLVTTIPLQDLTTMFYPQPSADVLQEASELKFRALTLLYLQYEEEVGFDDTWLYFPEEHVPFSRIYSPDNFAPHRRQAGKSFLCVEFPCAVGSKEWRQSSNELARIADDLVVGSGLVKSRSVDSMAIRIKEGYPLYKIGYEEHLCNTLNYLSSFRNCLSTGREGLFRHNNLDQSIQMGLLAGEYILNNDDCDAWYESTSQFNDYRIID